MGESKAPICKIILVAASVLFVSACSNLPLLSREQTQDERMCEKLEELGLECHEGSTRTKTPVEQHSEYSQQLKPIYERESVLELEIEDIRRHH